MNKLHSILVNRYSLIAKDNGMNSQQEIEDKYQLLIMKIFNNIAPSSLVYGDITALKHFYNLPRANTSNIIKFKIKNNTSIDLKELLTELSERFTNITGLSTQTSLAHVSEIRNIHGELYIPYEHGLLSTGKTTYNIIYDKHPVYDLVTKNINDDVIPEALNGEFFTSSLPTLMCENLTNILFGGENKAENVFDMFWSQDNGVHLKLVQLEQCLNDLFVNNVEQRMLSFVSIAQSERLLDALEKLPLANKNEYNNRYPTSRLFAEKMVAMLESVILPITGQFSEQFEQNRMRTFGVLPDESNISDQSVGASKEMAMAITQLRKHG